MMINKYKIRNKLVVAGIIAQVITFLIKLFLYTDLSWYITISPSILVYLVILFVMIKYSVKTNKLKEKENSGIIE